MITIIFTLSVPFTSVRIRSAACSTSSLRLQALVAQLLRQTQINETLKIHFVKTYPALCILLIIAELLLHISLLALTVGF